MPRSKQFNAPFDPPLGPRPYTENLYSTETTAFNISTDAEKGHASCPAPSDIICTTKPFPYRFSFRFYTANTERKNLLFKLKKYPTKAYTTSTKYNFTIVFDNSHRSGLRSTVEFENAADGRKIELSCRTNWNKSLTKVKLGKQLVAQTHPSEMSNTYSIEVAPMVDLSLVMALGVAHSSWRVKKGKPRPALPALKALRSG
ncbi:hypothetical protein K470DRAFT_286182 [Piedraia hortae CBS 480.64]|uniref:Uncharacterized protein n=1 Tax=Piedraia hortae CBS 480.64 TaxID=1314780 RepID=A0A6A7C9K7_9PEZI|nr:hypothetical protein K470DRAFT_286182 [Piedraia hortae CBS 480.64]